MTFALHQAFSTGAFSRQPLGSRRPSRYRGPVALVIYIASDEGWLYLGAVIDLFWSRWSDRPDHSETHWRDICRNCCILAPKFDGRHAMREPQ